MKTIYNKVNSVLCFAKEKRTSIVLIIEIVEIRILSEVCKLTKKTPSHRTVYLGCDVYKV